MTGLPNIAILGKAGAGKTTGATFLAENMRYRKLSFAAALKRIAVQIWGPDAATDRDKLQKLGVAVRDIYPDSWVEILERELEATRYTSSTNPLVPHQRVQHPIVIDDCRFENEATMLQAHGFVFVRVLIPRQEQIARLTASGKFQSEEQLDHVSETSLDHWDVQYNIQNDDRVQYLGTLHEIVQRGWT